MKMTGARLALLTVLAALIAAEAIDVDDFYPFDKNSENHLPRADAAWSSEIVLSVPINYYNRTHSSVWVHTDGFVSFSNEAISIGSLVDTEFPLYDSLIAPYMANLDISEQGHIVYEETHDSTVLARATDDVQRAFPDAAKDFEPQSVFIATWKNVKGFSLEGEPASFTFQLAIVSSGSDSFAIFLYPKRKMGSMEEGKKPRTNMFEAKAGFNMGGQKFLEMYPAENLVDYDNTQRKGEWIFQIGGEGVVNRDDVIDPERRRLVRRDALVNVQEVDLSDSFSDEDLEEERRMPERFFDYCARDGHACMVNNSMCVNHNDGYCCQCESGYVGNGRICADAYQNLMISGNVSGTVDIRHQDGTVNRVEVNSAFQGFSIVSLGRAHAALTPVPEELGAALKAIVPIGEISAWLFASSDSPAINGFDYTGGRFQRQLSIRFRDGGYRFDMRQRFHGAFFRNDELFVNATGHCVGVLPAVSLEQLIDVSDVESTYIREAPGRITMSATHSYTADGQTYEYDVTETIIFSECADSRNAVPSRLTLKMSTIFVQADQDTVRWAQDAKVEVSDHSSSVVAVRPRQPQPCDGGNKCGDGDCIPQGRSYRCRCPQGQKEVFDDQNRSNCEEEYDDYNIQIHACDIDEICGVGVCIEVADGFRCQCPEGYLELNENGFGSCQGQFETDDYDQYDPCEDNDCDVGRCHPDGRSYVCDCPPGYRQEVRENGRSSCVSDQEVVEEEVRFDPCHLNDCGEGRCVANGDSYRCRCPRGFQETFNSDRKASCQEEVVEEVRFDPCHLNDCGEGRCVANGDSYRCRCPRGFQETFNSDRKASCQAQLPGLQKPCEVEGICGRVGQCRPDGNSYRCDCPQGFYEVQDTYGSRCEAQDLPELRNPCVLRDVCANRGRCTPTRTSFRCQCFEGYEEVLETYGSRCEDIDECSQSDNICSPYADCNNYDGSYECVCKEGYNGDGRNCRPNERRDSRCERARQYAMEKSQRGYVNVEVPECSNDGLWVRRQCNLDGECWCVEEETGAVVDGTRSNSGYVNCDDDYTGAPSGETKCQQQYREGQNRRRHNPASQDVLDCTPEGQFMKRQCTSYEDVCWCVHPDTGETIEGTMTEQGSGHLLDCDATRRNPHVETECERQYREAVESHSSNRPEDFVYPDCTNDGFFQKRQCAGFGDICWCVDPYTGDEIEGTRSRSQRGLNLDCENLDNVRTETECQRQYREVDEMFRSNPTIADLEHPRCTHDGLFEKRQCMAWPDVCRCVDQYTGETIEGTITEPNEGHLLNCEDEDIAPETECMRRLRLAQQQSADSPSSRVQYPDCNDDGMFNRRQCNSYDDSCWCVDEVTGEEVDGTRTARGRGTTLTCDVNDAQGPCDQGSNPCGVGTCVEAHGQHRCYCPDGYTEMFNVQGSTCEVESTPATPATPVQPQHMSEFATCDEPSPCGGVGECVDRPNAHHRCRCPSGYVEVPTERGSKCEEAGDMCQNVPNVCSGKGDCVPQRDTYRCRCNRGYTEYFVDGHGDCQSETASPCSANPCGDYGDCVPDNRSYRCRCADGFVEVVMSSGNTCSRAVTPEDITEEGEEDSGEVTTEEPRRREQSECERQLRRSYRNRNGQNVVCQENGDFEIRQCDRNDDICWCVHPQTGEEIQDTRTENGYGRALDCENPTHFDNSTTMTACQEDKWIMQSYGRNDEIPEGMYEPDCTNAGAYEPVQRYDGYYHCVDFNGLEVSRHRSRPECYTPCQLAAYYANTENIFAETDNFVPECTNDGEYEPVQCDLNYCYCVDANGNQVDDSMTYVDSREARLDMDQRCQQGSGSTEYVEERPQYHEPSPPNKVIFAQGAGLQSINLPINEETKAQRLYDSSRRLIVGVDFDCASKYVYFSGVREPAIYRAPLNDFDQVEQIVRRSLRSPEGVAVDHLSGNIYWADSGTRRIEVAKADGSMRTVLVSRGLVNPRGIAVDPVGGKLYWSDWHRQNPRIMIANMDGSEARVFVKEGLKLPNNVEIDLYHKKLCFVDAGTYMIECMNLDGTDRRVVADMSGDNKPRMAFGLEVSGGYVYYTDRKASRIHQIDIQTGEDTVMRGPMGVHAQMFGITLSYDECPRENNYCARDNGGCAENQLCLPVPHGRVCKCPKGSSDCVDQ